eukprot:CAMPEP_0173091260 /NCGR_PEP_ID=MMETSP1102-20130122/27789_1 /TAXON_ID=49646 /ORGANISM="Geminigera sp., Strain Caron Lab Isolate" /LENGTH=59 /DNA_ID=CAMNT_0013977051 /DNA_START=1039 /DNA_END=1215 /DNA_ORIENTATION=-
MPEDFPNRDVITITSDLPVADLAQLFEEEVKVSLLDARRRAWLIFAHTAFAGFTSGSLV